MQGTGTYGNPTASARHTPAEPLDWRDLSVERAVLVTRGTPRFVRSSDPAMYKQRKKRNIDAQNPVNTASLGRSLDMAPMSQYAYVCHMESRRP